MEPQWKRLLTDRQGQSHDPARQRDRIQENVNWSVSCGAVSEPPIALCRATRPHAVFPVVR